MWCQILVCRACSALLYLIKYPPYVVPERKYRVNQSNHYCPAHLFLALVDTLDCSTHHNLQKTFWDNPMLSNCVKALSQDHPSYRDIRVLRGFLTCHQNCVNKKPHCPNHNCWSKSVDFLTKLLVALQNSILLYMPQLYQTAIEV